MEELGVTIAFICTRYFETSVAKEFPIGGNSYDKPVTDVKVAYAESLRTHFPLLLVLKFDKSASPVLVPLLIILPIILFQCLIAFLTLWNNIENLMYRV